MILTPRLAPKRPQNDPKTVPKSCVFHLRFLLRIWTVFSSILIPFGTLLAPPNPHKIGPDFFGKSTCGNITHKTAPRDPSSEAPPQSRVELWSVVLCCVWCCVWCCCVAVCCVVLCCLVVLCWVCCVVSCRLVWCCVLLCCCLLSFGSWDVSVFSPPSVWWL